MTDEQLGEIWHYRFGPDVNGCRRSFVFAQFIQIKILIQTNKFNIKQMFMAGELPNHVQSTEPALRL